MATGTTRGYDIIYNHTENRWEYEDTREVAFIGEERPCKRCKEMPTVEGHDFCLSQLGKVVSACCGHGSGEGFIVFDSGIKAK